MFKFASIKDSSVCGLKFNDRKFALCRGVEIKIWPNLASPKRLIDEGAKFDRRAIKRVFILAI